MFITIAYALAVIPLLVQLGLANAGDGVEGTTMGPVAFLWPEDRPWSASYDNTGPCGSSALVTNRTEFPLGSIGSIELTIAEESYDLAVRIAYGNDPTSQDEFKAIKGNVSMLELGHQCYPIPTEPSEVVAGSNATIQLEYWADDTNKNQSFFACADITFVEASTFTEQVYCFNASVAEVHTTQAGSTPTAIQPVVSATSTTATAQNSRSGLSGGSKAGIAVGTIVGVLFLAAAAWFIHHKFRAAHRDTESAIKLSVKTADAASLGSN